MKYLNIGLGIISLLIYPVLILFTNIGVYNPEHIFYLAFISVSVISFCIMINIVIYAVTREDIDRYILALSIFMFSMIIIVSAGRFILEIVFN